MLVNHLVSFIWLDGCNHVSLHLSVLTTSIVVVVIIIIIIIIIVIVIIVFIIIIITFYSPWGPHRP